MTNQQIKQIILQEMKNSENNVKRHSEVLANCPYPSEQRFHQTHMIIHEQYAEKFRQLFNSFED